LDSRKDITKQTLLNHLTEAANDNSVGGKSDAGETNVIGTVFHAFLDFLEGESVDSFNHLQVGKIDLRAIARAESAHCVDPRGWLFEHWLANYQASQRKTRGVYFTPAPVTNYLVDAVGHLLKTRFDFADSNASDATKQDATIQGAVIIDPACGCGAFLSTVAERWPELELGALPRCLGLEIDETTASIARRLLPRRVTVNTLNALTLCPETAPLELSGAKPLIVLGNPPYSNFAGAAHSDWMHGLLADYTVGLDERKHNLHDDCIKFIRWSQFWLEQSGSGIAALVVNNTFATGLTHRQMRESLKESFDEIYLVDLGGEDNRNGSNIFGIRQAVGLLVLVKLEKPDAAGCRIQRAELHGSREEKFAQLEATSFATTPWKELPCGAPKFCHQTVAAPEYAEFIPLNELFREYVSGVQTKNDRVFTAHSCETLESNVRRYLKQLPDDSRIGFRSSAIRRYLTAPFDRRFIYYEPRLLGRPRVRVMQQMHFDNLGFVFMRQSVNEGDYDHFLVTRDIVSDRVFYSRRGAPFLAPLWLYQTDEFGNTTRQPNFSDAFWRAVCAATGSNRKQPISPNELFAYIYGVVYAPWYRERYATSLKDDFPRIPLPSDRNRFDALATLGEQLVVAHTSLVSEFENESRIERGYPKYCNQQVWLNEDHALEVAENIWRMRIGGYAVLPRWLKQRRKLKIGTEESSELASLIDALGATIQIQERLGSLEY